MTKNDLESRKEKVLALIVEDYINTAIPISSRAISRRLRKSLSSATIRNVMSDLEEAGLITHPHTSAGRIPTDTGYRYYVNTLMQVKLLTEEERKRIDKTFKQKAEEIDDILSDTSRLLSSIAQEAGFVMSPRFEKGIFSRIELLELSEEKILTVLITDSGLTKDVVVKFEKPLRKGDLNKIANFLNARFNGISLTDIKKAITQQLLIEKDSFFYIINETKQIIDLMLDNIKSDKVYLDGASRLIMQPEFKNNFDRTEDMLNVLEDPIALTELVQKNLDKEGTEVYIGEEIGMEGLSDCSFIVTGYAMRNNRMGTLGVIGPKRMQYSKIISLVDYVSKLLSEALE